LATVERIRARLVRHGWFSERPVDEVEDPYDSRIVVEMRTRIMSSGTANCNMAGYTAPLALLGVRGRLAAAPFLALEPREPELQLLHRWLCR